MEKDMSSSAKIRRAPVRLASGAFVLNAGLDHLKADDQTAGQVHEMAAVTYPFVGKVDAKTFTKRWPSASSWSAGCCSRRSSGPGWPASR